MFCTALQLFSVLCETLHAANWLAMGPLGQLWHYLVGGQGVLVM